MAIRTMVAILRADATGENDMIGTGSLLTARSVLVHPPLTHMLVSGGVALPLRVCVASWPAAGPVVEVIDVASVNVAGERWSATAGEFTARRHPLVELVLQSAASSRGGLVNLTDAERILAHLADPFNGPAAVTGPIVVGPNVLCDLTGICC